MPNEEYGYILDEYGQPVDIEAARQKWERFRGPMNAGTSIAGGFRTAAESLSPISWLAKLLKIENPMGSMINEVERSLDKTGENWNSRTMDNRAAFGEQDFDVFASMGPSDWKEFDKLETQEQRKAWIATRRDALSQGKSAYDQEQAGVRAENQAKLDVNAELMKLYQNLTSDINNDPTAIDIGRNAYGQSVMSAAGRGIGSSGLSRANTERNVASGLGSYAKERNAMAQNVLALANSRELNAAQMKMQRDMYMDQQRQMANANKYAYNRNNSILPLAGTLIGGYVGGPAGAQLGSSIGGYMGQGSAGPPPSYTPYGGLNSSNPYTSGTY